MLSRTAEAIYWMSRYIERAENIARVVDVNLQLMLEIPEITEEHWRALIMTNGDLELFNKSYSDFNEKNVIQFLTFDKKNPNSIFTTVNAARENARSIREIISSEMWEYINTFYLIIQTQSRKRNTSRNQHSFFNEIKVNCHLFEGVMASTMSHEEAWHFGMMGRYIERADKTSRIMDVRNFVPVLEEEEVVRGMLESAQWSAVLKSVSSLEMYRKKYKTEINAKQVYEFLILSATFPRAIRYCLHKVKESLQAITELSPISFTCSSAVRQIGKLCASLDYAEISEIMETTDHKFIDQLQVKFNHFDQVIYETFFAKRPII